MKTLQKSGGIATLYMAISHLIGLVIFIAVLDYLNITDPAQKLALTVEKQSVIFSTNLLMYVFFGFALIVLSLAFVQSQRHGRQRGTRYYRCALRQGPDPGRVDLSGD